MSYSFNSEQIHLVGSFSTQQHTCIYVIVKELNRSLTAILCYFIMFNFESTIVICLSSTAHQFRTLKPIPMSPDPQDLLWSGPL